MIEDDPSDSMLSREEIQNNNQPVELRGVASGSDNALVGKNCVVKLNGSHKGQTGVVVAYTYGIYSLNLHDPPDTKLLLLPEDLEVSTGKIELRPSQPKIEEDSSANSQSGMRVAITSGKHDGRVGMICTVENGTYSIRFGNSEEVKVKGQPTILIPNAKLLATSPRLSILLLPSESFASLTQACSHSGLLSLSLGLSQPWSLSGLRSLSLALTQAMLSQAKKWRSLRPLLNCLLDTRALPRWCNPMRNLQRRSLQDTANCRSASTQAQQGRWCERKTDGVA